MQSKPGSVLFCALGEISEVCVNAFIWQRSPINLSGPAKLSVGILNSVSFISSLDVIWIAYFILGDLRYFVWHVKYDLPSSFKLLVMCGLELVVLRNPPGIGRVCSNMAYAISDIIIFLFFYF